MFIISAGLGWPKPTRKRLDNTLAGILSKEDTSRPKLALIIQMVNDRDSYQPGWSVRLIIKILEYGNMRKLVSVRQILDCAEESGLDPESLVVDPDDIAQLDEDMIDDLAQNPRKAPEESEEED
jgi:hypothetical protein